MYPDHTFSYLEDLDGYGGYRLVIDGKYADNWFYEDMIWGTDPIDLEYMCEEIDWFLKKASENG